MKLALDQLFLLGVFSASIHWLIARSTIAKPLWSRARGTLDKMLRCPACSGWWIGAWLPWAGIHPLDGVPLWANNIAGALCGVVLTPVFEAVLLWGLERSAVEDEEEPPPTGGN